MWLVQKVYHLYMKYEIRLPLANPNALQMPFLPCHILGGYPISITEAQGDFLGRGVASGVNNY